MNSILEKVRLNCIDKFLATLFAFVKGLIIDELGTC